MNGAAIEWFRRATKLDPDKETAYRYWGDSLMRLGRMEEARSTFIDGVVANPYTTRSWSGLNQWAQKHQLQFYVPRLRSPNDVKLDGKKTNIIIDPSSFTKSDGSLAWMLYDMNRALWVREKFFKEFPAETKYRHSLKEEADSLHLAAISARQQAKEKKTTLDPALTDLVKLDDAGLVEAYVLFFQADAGISQDYPVYREKNRDKLRKYLDEFVVPKTPSPDSILSR